MSKADNSGALITLQMANLAPPRFKIGVNRMCGIADVSKILYDLWLGIDGVDGMTWQSGQGGSPSPEEEVRLKEAEGWAIRSAHSIFFQLTGKNVTACLKSNSGQYPNADREEDPTKLTGMISMASGSHERDVGRLYCVLNGVIGPEDQHPFRTDAEEGYHDRKGVAEDAAKEIFMGLTGMKVLKYA